MRVSSGGKKRWAHKRLHELRVQHEISYHVSWRGFPEDPLVTGPYDTLRTECTRDGSPSSSTLPPFAVQCNFIDHDDMKIVYRRYASLFFLVGVDGDENELEILEFIHCIVETLDKWFSNVCELDILFSLEVAHFIIDEMCANGCIIETNKQNVLAPIQLLERAS